MHTIAKGLLLHGTKEYLGKHGTSPFLTKQFTQEQAVSTMRQSTTTLLVENAIYTTIMEVIYSFVDVLLVGVKGNVTVAHQLAFACH